MRKRKNNGPTVKEWAATGYEMTNEIAYSEMLGYSQAVRLAFSTFAQEVCIFSACKVREAVSETLRCHSEQDVREISDILTIDDSETFFELDNLYHRQFNFMQIYGGIHGNLSFDNKITDESFAIDETVMHSIIFASLLAREATGKLRIPGLGASPVFEALVTKRYSSRDVEKFVKNLPEHMIWPTAEIVN